MKDVGDTICSWCTWNDPQRIGTGTGKLRNQSICRNHRDYTILKIGQNAENIPGDLRRLDVTQSPVKNHQ